MEEDPDWKPATIKLETEFIIKENDEGEEFLIEGCTSQVQSTNVEDGSDFTSEAILSTSDVLDENQEIKVECTEDDSPSTDQFQLIEYHVSPAETADSSLEVSNTKLEDDSIEDQFHGVGCDIPMVEMPSSVLAISAGSSFDGIEMKSEGEILESHELTPHLDFEAVTVKIEPVTDVEASPSAPVDGASETTKPKRRVIVGRLMKRILAASADAPPPEKKQPLPGKSRKAQSKKNVGSKKSAVSPGDDRPFACGQCAARYKWKSTLDQHLLVHSTKKRFSCDHCTERFKTKAQLKTHSPAECREKKFCCDQCPKRFTLKAHFMQHVSRNHTDERPWACKQCSAVFKTKHELKVHLVIHSDERPFSCDQCSLSFKRKHDLKEHMRTHTDERPIKCKQCSAQFKGKRDLRLHMMYHSDERRFVCDQCPDRRYRLKSELEEHNRIHTGEKPFACAQCHARFARRSSLRKHLTSHSNVRPFTCEQCSRSFKRRYVLNEHLRSHSAKESVPNMNSPEKVS